MQRIVRQHKAIYNTILEGVVLYGELEVVASKFKLRVLFEAAKYYGEEEYPQYPEFVFVEPGSIITITDEILGKIPLHTKQIEFAKCSFPTKKEFQLYRRIKAGI